MGRPVPEELSILSLLDWDGLAAASPSLTAMHLSDREMSKSTCDFLLEVIQKGFRKEVIKKIDYRLIERNSVAVPFAAKTLKGGGEKKLIAVS